MLFSTITIFREDNRALQLRYRKVARYESRADEVLSDPVPALRRQLASPRLSFRGRQERDDSDLRALAGEWRTGSESTSSGQPTEPHSVGEERWTQIGLRELLGRLDEEQRVQAEVIRAAAHEPNGQLARALVYELGEYEDGRTLRGFTRPVNRVTRQLQRSGLIAANVAPALEPVYEHDGQVSWIAVPPDIRELLTAAKGAPHAYGSGPKKNAIKGPDDFLTRIPGAEYQHALRHIFSTLADVQGMRIYWGTTGCSLRVALPGRGPLSVGWIFPPGIPRWMGLTDLTLGWYEDDKGIEISELGRVALENYIEKLGAFGGEIRPDSGVIRGWTFRPPATTAYAPELAEIIRTAVFQLRDS